MAETYQWRAATKFASDTTLSYGVVPNDQSQWQTDEIGSSHESKTWTWFYRDTNTSYAGSYQDRISSRVAVSITESWTTRKDSVNNLIVTVRVTVNSIVRDDLRGTDQNTPGRNIRLYKEQGGSQILNLTDTQVATAHTIYSGPLVVDEYSFTIAPGEQLEKSSLYLHNQTVGGASYDDIWLGVQFKNTLPKDYRPGNVRYNGEWKSTNRSVGKCHVRQNGQWVEMRTLNGGSGTGNPPSRRTGGAWKNQYKIGSE